MPLPTTRLIPAGWQTHHRPVAEGGMTCQVTVTRAGTGEGTYDEATGHTTPAADTAVASCAARIQARAASDRVSRIGDQDVTFRGYLVQVPIDAGDIHVSDQLEVTTVGPDDDPQLLGTVLRVVDVMYGSLTWARDLVCEDDLG